MNLNSLQFYREHVWGMAVPLKALAKQSTLFGRGGIAFTPAKQKKFQTLISRLAEINAPIEPFDDCFLELQIIVITQYNKADMKKAKYEYELDNKRPDFDNLSKPICDGLSKIIYKDDSRISVGRVVKLKGYTPELVLRLAKISLIRE